MPSVFLYRYEHHQGSRFCKSTPGRRDLSPSASQSGGSAMDNKAYEGREDEIRNCIGCLHCFESLMMYGTARCTVNSKLGMEKAFDGVQAVEGGKSSRRRRRPRGHASASVLSGRGYEVTLMKRKPFSAEP